MPEPQYLIWSNEHRRWWKAGEFGYTLDVEEAGLYPRSRAMEVCRRALMVWDAKSPPNEIPVLLFDALDCGLRQKNMMPTTWFRLDTVKPGVAERLATLGPNERIMTETALFLIRNGGVWVSAFPHAEGIPATTRPSILVVGDDLDRSRGPTAFDQDCLAEWLAAAIQVSLMIGYRPDVYTGMGRVAVTMRSIGIVCETQRSHAIEWARFLQSHDVGGTRCPVLLVLETGDLKLRDEIQEIFD